jgi:two-component system nitrogen regulation response regulator NtrX
MAGKSETMKNRKFLVVDDHRNIRFSLKITLEDEGAIVDEAENYHQGLVKLGDLKSKNSFPFHMVFLDIRLPDGSGLDILRQLSEAGYASRVIMISGEGTVTEAFQATQMGAFDYIEKPFAPERLLVSVRRCLDFHRIQDQNESLNKQVLKGQEIIGNHPKVLEMMNIIKRVAPTNGRVLILGESGTGKELVARHIHRLSERPNKPLIKVNCAAIPHSLIESELFGHEKGAFTGALRQRKGLFEQADGGTLFLDEIGELSLDVQAKLLRVLQNGEVSRLGSEKIITVDVRLLAATHRDLDEMVQDGLFREDLFYRLNVISVFVPPLRERGKDIDALAEHFLIEACHENSLGDRSFGERVYQQLHEYHWPGNIRELKNRIERAAILSETDEILQLDGMPLRANSESSPRRNDESAKLTVGQVAGDQFSFATGIVPWQELHGALDKSYIKYVLNHTEGNVSEAARLLCLERAYLHRLMKKLGIQRGIVVSEE